MHPTFLLLVPSPQVALHYKGSVTWKEISESAEQLAEGGQCCTFSNNITDFSDSYLPLLLSKWTLLIVLKVYTSREN